MPTEFICSCGEPLFDEDAGEAIECSRCHRVFVPKPTETGKEEEAAPLVESAAAKVAAWGCLFPVGFLFVLLGASRLFLHQHLSASLWASGGVVSLVIFGWILKKQRCTARGFVTIAGITSLMFAAITWSMWKWHQYEAELDAKFSCILSESKDVAKKPKNAQMKIRPKYLPVILTPPGTGQRSQPPRVFGELYGLLPEELRANNPDEVHTVILIDWWYKKVGIYRSMDALKEKMANIYQGGCTLTFVDRSSQTITCEHELMPPNKAPETRDGEDTLDWYGSQPAMIEVLNYIKTVDTNTR